MTLSGFKIADTQPRPVQGDERLFEIGEVAWWSETDQVAIRMSDEFGVVEVLFHSPISYRAQDEGEMLAHWAARGAENVDVATIYTIEQSDYLASFANNSVRSFSCTLRHWLIAGKNQCVEVIADADDHPTIRELERFHTQ